MRTSKLTNGGSSVVKCQAVSRGKRPGCGLQLEQGLFNTFYGCEQCAHMCYSSSHPLPLTPITYWELGERAQALLASKITPQSTRCLRAHRAGEGSERPASCHTATPERSSGCFGNRVCFLGKIEQAKKRGGGKKLTVRCFDICGLQPCDCNVLSVEEKVSGIKQ